MTGKITVAPILLNLSGSYVIPVDGQPPVAGSVSGDLRLPVLDAFLAGLDGPLRPGSVGAAALADAISQLANKIVPRRNCDVVLSITTTVNLENNSLTHDFKLTTQKRIS